MRNEPLQATRHAGGCGDLDGAAIGAAIAVSLGAGGFYVAQAGPEPSESTIVTVSPERILDTRDPNNIGLPGPFDSQASYKLQVTGSVPTANGPLTVVPTGATGVLLNVTPVNATADGFISIRPGDASGTPTTSSLNFTTGISGIVPNAVQVGMPTAGPNAGKIDITYDAYGRIGPTTDLLIDVVGYMTSTGLQELVADVEAIAQGEIVMSNSTSQLLPYQTNPAAIDNLGTGSVVGPGFAVMGIEGPVTRGGVQYGLKSIQYCIRSGTVDSVQVFAQASTFIGQITADNTDRTVGCHTVTVNDSSAVAYGFVIDVSVSATISGVRTTWAPASALPLAEQPPTGGATEIESAPGDVGG